MEKPTDLSDIDSPAEPPMNDLAIASFVAGVGGWILAVIGICPFVSALTGGLSSFGCSSLSLGAWILAIPLGVWAQQRIKTQGAGGENLARLGLISGIAGLAITVLLFCVVLGLVLAGTLTLPFLD